jgi:large subunit ribosomal protein L19
MANTLQKFEARQVEKLGKTIPDFSPGDTVKVNIRIKEGERERIQAYEGICIARFGAPNSINASFTVRKISLGEGVERVFPLLSPQIESIELVRRGSVRRAKLYYLRDRRGKSARIVERTTGHGLETEVTEDANLTKTQKTAKKQEAKKAASAEARKAQEAKAKAKADAAKAAEAPAEGAAE